VKDAGQAAVIHLAASSVSLQAGTVMIRLSRRL
jgi:hypothetical protein